jgi:hypothetical protein
MTAHIEEVDGRKFCQDRLGVKSARFRGFLGAMVLPGPCADR